MSAQRAANPRGIVGHEPMKGFSDKSIYSNVRFKIFEQLRAAGLHATPYAQKLVSQLPMAARPVHDVSAAGPWG